MYKILFFEVDPPPPAFLHNLFWHAPHMPSPPLKTKKKIGEPKSIPHSSGGRTPRNGSSLPRDLAWPRD